MAPDRRPETEPAGPDHPLVQTIGALWQLPFIAFTSWCNLMTGAWAGALPAGAREDKRHCQLVVPEPIEVAGEHALFA